MTVPHRTGASDQMRNTCFQLSPYLAGRPDDAPRIVTPGARAARPGCAPSPAPAEPVPEVGAAVAAGPPGPVGAVRAAAESMPQEAPSE